MKLEVLKCPSCGANIEFEEGVTSCECEYCGANVTIASTSGVKNSSAVSGIKNTNATNAFKNPQQPKPVVLKPTGQPTAQEGPVRKFTKTILNVLFVFNLFMAGFGLVMTVTDFDISSLLITLFFLIYAGMFKVLALTPKGSKHVLGKENGLKPVYFVLICILLSFLVLGFFPSTEDENTTANETNTSITEQAYISE